jgi:hypothetical protein
LRLKIDVLHAGTIYPQFSNPATTNDFIFSTAENGPLLSRLAIAGQLEQPMFSVSVDIATSFFSYLTTSVADFSAA